MNYHLVVMKSFQDFKRGDVIEESGAMEKILAGPRAGFVVRVSAGKE